MDSRLRGNQVDVMCPVLNFSQVLKNKKVTYQVIHILYSSAVIQNPSKAPH